jgi:hypothetical protein
MSGGSDTDWVILSLFRIKRRITMADVHVTVNGVSVEKVIDEAIRAEYRSHMEKEVKSMAFVAAMSKSRNSFRFRNHSGSRSGLGRVIYSAGGVA